jgi:hypothetical protein
MSVETGFWDCFASSVASSLCSQALTFTGAGRCVNNDPDWYSGIGLSFLSISENREIEK